MPLPDDAQILQVPLKAQGAKADDWSSVRANDLTQLNSVLRQLQEQIHKLSGRTGDSAIRSALDVAGNVSSGGNLSALGGGLLLGATTITQANPSFAPTVEAALTPRALNYAPLLGAKADLLSASPFTWTLSEHFLGGGVAGTGDIGELGWTATGAPTVGLPTAEANHPGVVSLDTNGSALTALYLQAPLTQSDLSYLAFTVQNTVAFRTQMSVGFRDFTTGAKGSSGAYFSYSFSGGSGMWQTTTRSSAGVLTNTSGIVVADAEWVLLEIVFGEDFVDFFADRTRLFRHTGVSVDPANRAYICSMQEQGPSDTTVLHDRVVASGRGIDKIWT